MGTSGFRDLRTEEQLKTVPGYPAAKNYLMSVPKKGGFLSGAVFGMQALASKAKKSILAAAKSIVPNAVLKPFKLLGVQLTEEEVKPLNPRFPDQPTTSPLARGERAKTIVQDKLRNQIKSARLGVGTPRFFGKFLNLASITSNPLFTSVTNKMFSPRGSYKTWSEPVTPYNPKYPYNQVQETESGHVIEIDDTPGAERVHIYHRTGTFIECHPDGNMVIKSVKDLYQIALSDGNWFVGGNCNITVQGDTKIYAKGNLDFQVDGGVAFQSKRMKFFAENLELIGQRQIKLDAPIINLRYFSLPSSFSLAQRYAATGPLGAVPLIVPAAKTLSIVNGAISGLANLLPSTKVPEFVPLTNPELYKNKTPKDIDQRARTFDSPDTLSDLNDYWAHTELSTKLGDFTEETKRIPGVLVGQLDQVVNAVEPAVDLKDYAGIEDHFVFPPGVKLGKHFTVQDLAPPELATKQAAANTRPTTAIGTGIEGANGATSNTATEPVETTRGPGPGAQEAYNALVASTSPHTPKAEMEAAIEHHFGHLPQYGGAYKESVMLNGDWYDMIGGYDGPEANWHGLMLKVDGGSAAGEAGLTTPEGDDTPKFLPGLNIPENGQLGLLEDEIGYRLQLLVVNVLDPIKEKYPDMKLLEGFKISNTGKSQHERGEAADIAFPGVGPEELVARATWIRDNIAYDQLILCYSNVGTKTPWIHVSFSPDGRRRDVYTKDFTDAFHKGLGVYRDYVNDAERQVVLEEANKLASELEVEISKREKRASKQYPVTAESAGTTGKDDGALPGVGSSGEPLERPAGYVPQWSGMGSTVIDTMYRLQDVYPGEWAAASNEGGHAGAEFMRLVVIDLRAQGIDCALNGKRGNPSDISEDVIVFPNPTGSSDTTGTQPGLEGYDCIGGAGGGAANPQFLDITSTVSGAWVEP